MYLFVDKKTNAVLHVANASPGDERKPEELFRAFDPATMQVGHAPDDFIPARFKIEAGVVKDLDPPPTAAPPETLEQAKARKLRKFSTQALALRAQLIPDHQLLNAGLGLDDDDWVQSLRSTVQAFRDEYHRLAAAVAKATSIKELEALQPAFPTGLARRDPSGIFIAAAAVPTALVSPKPPAVVQATATKPAASK